MRNHFIFAKLIECTDSACRDCYGNCRNGNRRTKGSDCGWRGNNAGCSRCPSRSRTHQYAYNRNRNGTNGDRPCHFTCGFNLQDLITKIACDFNGLGIVFYCLT